MNRFRFVLMAAVCVALLTGLLSVINLSAATRAEAKGQSPVRIEDPTTPPVTSRPEYTVTLGAWRNLRPTESTLNGVSLLSPDYAVNCQDADQKSQGWIVGDNGVILTYCNGVWEHAIIVESVPTSLFTVQAISPTLGVAVGDQGAVLLYLYDRVANDWVWTKSPIPIGNQRLYGVSMVPNGSGDYTGWAVGMADPNAGGRGALIEGTIYAPITTTGTPTPTHSYNWTNRTNDFGSLPPIVSYYAVHTLSPTNAWAVGATLTGTGIIVHWDGTTWDVAQYVDSALYGLRMRNVNDGWAVGASGATYHYTGNAWVKVSSSTQEILTGVGYAANGETWAVGYKNTQIKLVNGVWMTPALEDHRTDPFDFRAIDFSSGHGWLVGGHFSKNIGGQILEYDNGLWLAVTPPTDNQLNDVAVVSDNDAWAVGAADEAGGTIIHWDGKHWQRWYQHDLPIPAADLYAIDMTSAADGWAAGDPLTPGAPAVFLHWDGQRWAAPRYDAPVNVRVNALDMIDEFFGWAVADGGDAVAKYNSGVDYWNANHSCQGLYYQLRDTSLALANNPWGNWDAWAVGSIPNPYTAVFLRFMSGCASSNAWDIYDVPSACPPVPNPDDGPSQTKLWGIKMMPGPAGYSVGDYKNRASIYQYDDVSGHWQVYFCQAENSPTNPSRFYSVDIVNDSGVVWTAGYYWQWSTSRKVAYISYIDASGRQWAGDPFPVNGRNIYDRPVKRIRMSSDTMGWAVGDPEDGGKRSIIYQYPYPNFTLDTAPAARAVLPGGSTFFTVTAASLGGFSADVNLSILNLPNGITYSVSAPVVNRMTVATITFTVAATTTLGAYDIPLLGSTTFRSGDNDFLVERVSYLRLTVTNHPLYLITPDHAAAGTTVSIAGANFGADPGVGNRNTATEHVMWAGVQLPDANVLSWSNTLITFLPLDNPDSFKPRKFPLVGAVSVTAGGTSSNADQLFKIDNRLTGISTARSASAITLTVKGTSLGSDPGSLLRSTYYEHVSVNGSWVANLNVKGWSNSAITFTMPLTVTNGTVVITSNGYESNALNFSVAGYKNYLPLVRKG